jgi:short-subunit dehydrogenase
VGTALVTGATSGIGLSLARQLAGRGHDLVLVARNPERLEVLAAEISRQFRVDCEVLVADLCDPQQCLAVENRVADADRPVEWLVNNAGFASKDSFDKSSVEAEQAQLDVLVRAPMRLTHAALPGMLARGRGRILIVSSVAGFIPGGTYSAEKAFTTVFAESLSAAYATSGVHVTALCPGFTHTEFHQRADMDMSKLPSWLWLDADFVAEAGLKACEAGRSVCVPGAVYKGIQLATSVLPRPLVRRAIGRSSR